MTRAITSVQGRQIYNSRAQLTVEVQVVTDRIHKGRAAAPSGASVGMHETASFPSGGIKEALETLQDNAGAFVGVDPGDTAAVHDAILSMGSGGYSAVGGSIAYAVSMAAAESSARYDRIPMYHALGRKESYRLPIPLGNILGGGAHAGAGTPDIQEILVCAPKAGTIQEAIEINARVHDSLGRLLSERDPRFHRGRGDEGGWAPSVDNETALKLSARACESLGYTLGDEVALGVDFASSTQYDTHTGTYRYDRAGFENDAGEQIEYVSDIIRRYRLAYAEDTVHEEAFGDMAEITSRFPDTLIVGDDLTVTNHAILEKAAGMRSCNAAILKVNQAGTLHDALLFAQTAQRHHISLITSHRSGETGNSHMAHVGVATGSMLLKAGVVGGERVAKLNELLRMSEHDLIQGPARLS